MKEQCDNHCETCPMSNQVHCAVLFARSTNYGLGKIFERLELLEAFVKGENANTIAPLELGMCNKEDSVILPTQETGEI